LRRWGTPEIGKRAMHLDNQSGELVGLDLMMPQIAADDLRDLVMIDPRRRVFCHRGSPGGHDTANFGINARGDIVGSFNDATGTARGFLLKLENRDEDED
jgi:hypothetical protein